MAGSNYRVQLLDDANDERITSTVSGASRGLDVNILNSGVTLEVNLDHTDDEVTVYGSRAQALSQKATSYELNTYDTNLATVLGTASLVSATPALKVEEQNTLTVDCNSSDVTVDNATLAVTQSGTWNIGTLTTITNVVHVDDNSSTLSIDDADSSITVDGSVTVSGTDIDIRDLDVAQDDILIYANTAKDGTGTDYIPLVDSAGHLQIDVLSAPTTAVTQSGTWNIGTVTTLTGITNDVNIADGGNTITVDGTVAATQSGNWDINDISKGTQSNDIKITLDSEVVSVEPDGTALGNGQVSVDDTADGTVIISASSGRQGIVITNQGSVTAYIGVSGVTTSNGFELKAGESVPLPTDSEVRGITASGSTNIGYLSFA